MKKTEKKYFKSEKSTLFQIIPALSPDLHVEYSAASELISAEVFKFSAISAWVHPEILYKEISLNKTVLIRLVVSS